MSTKTPGHNGVASGQSSRAVWLRTTGVLPCTRIMGQPTPLQCQGESGLEQCDLPLLPSSTRQGATTPQLNGSQAGDQTR